MPCLDYKIAVPNVQMVDSCMPLVFVVFLKGVMYLVRTQDLLLMPLNSGLGQSNVPRVQRDIASGKKSMQRKPSGNLSLTVQ